MYDLIQNYGLYVLGLVLGGIATLLAKFVFPRIKAGYARDLAQRAWVEIQGAAFEVGQVYVDGLKAASKDGTLTVNEKAAAKVMAIDVAKANIGAAGLKRLGRVLGVNIDTWLASKVEQAVAIQKLTKPAPLPKATAVRLPPLPA